jgi:hypothetical protein
MLRAGDAAAIQLESRRLFLSALCGARITQPTPHVPTAAPLHAATAAELAV